MIKKIIKNIYYFLFYSLNWIIFKIHRVQHNNKFRGRGIIRVRNNGICCINDNFLFNAGPQFNPIGGDTIFRLIIEKNAILMIGKNVGISNSTIYASCEIVIGDNVLIGGGCKIWDTDFHSLNTEIRLTTDDNVKKKSIKIEDNSWIGGASIILKGVTVGKNSIIGAGSVVTKDVPSNQVWAGNPAKFIRNIE